MGWNIRSQADAMAEQAAEHLARIFGDEPPRNAMGEFISPSPVTAEGDAPKERCPGCGRLRPVFELVDASRVPEHPGDYACGACRGSLTRRGVVSRGEWVARYGAPAALVSRLRAIDERGSRAI